VLFGGIEMTAFTGVSIITALGEPS
jgi:hypothetical protein